MNSVWKNVDGTWFQPLDVQVVYAPRYNKYDETWGFSVGVVNEMNRSNNIHWNGKDKDTITSLYNEVVEAVVGEQK